MRRGKTMKHSRGLAIPTTLEDVCDPQRMALLVYDMQVGICSQIKSESEIVTQISRLLAVARATGMRVLLVYLRPYQATEGGAQPWSVPQSSIWARSSDS